MSVLLTLLGASGEQSLYLIGLSALCTSSVWLILPERMLPPPFCFIYNSVATTPIANTVKCLLSMFFCTVSQVILTMTLSE